MITFIIKLLKVIVYFDFFNFQILNLDEEDDNLERENGKIQSEAKELIEKTRRMMESLDAHKMSNRESITINSSAVSSSMNFYNSEYFEEKPIDSTRIIKIEKDEVNRCNKKLISKIINHFFKN
jgi:hypothetical protein